MFSYKAVFFITCFLFIPTSALAQFPDTRPQCIIGSPEELRLERQLTDSRSVPDGNYLRHYLAGISIRSLIGKTSAGCINCEETNVFDGRNSSLLNSLTRNLRPRQSYINPQCVQRSVRRVLDSLSGSRGPTGQPTQMFACQSDSSTPQEMSKTPCLTTNYVNYISAAYNGAIRCLSSNDRRNHIDAQIAFSKLNNESGFGAFLRNSGGIGGSQMTSIALAEMTNPQHEGARKLRQHINSRGDRCAGYSTLLDGISVSQPPGCSGECFCQFTSVGNGMARNALVGIGLYLYYRDWKTNGSITSELLANGLRRDHPSFNQIRDYLTLVAFGADGPAGAQALIRRLRPVLQKNLSFSSLKRLVSERPPQGNCPSSWPVRSGKRCISFYNSYLGAIRQRMVQVFDSPDYSCTMEPGQ